MKWWGLAAITLVSGAVAEERRPAELLVIPGVPVAATVDGRPARLVVGSGRLDRLTLDAAYVAASGIKPTWLLGTAELSVAGRREFKGRNRPVTLGVAGATQRARAFWFPNAPDRADADGSVGPWGLPQPRVTFALAPARDGEQLFALPLQGSLGDNSHAVIGLDGQGIGLSFDVEDEERLPVATAAAGALIAKGFGGALEGPSWDVEVLLGVRRPVRLLRLARPMTIGPLSYDRIAVRVRDRLDDSGRGGTIAEAGEAIDPDEIVVADRKGATPNYVLSIPRSALGACSRLTYDKMARKIELSCRPTPID